MKRFLLAACFTLATASAFAGTILDDSYPDAAPRPFSVVEKTVTADFNDPRSAQFKHLSVETNEQGKTYLCGLVNAKNLVGGYTPFYPFYYDFAAGDAFLGQDYRDEILGPLVYVNLEIAGCGEDRLGIKLRPN